MCVRNGEKEKERIGKRESERDMNLPVTLSRMRRTSFSGPLPRLSNAWLIYEHKGEKLLKVRVRKREKQDEGKKSSMRTLRICPYA